MRIEVTFVDTGTTETFDVAGNSCIVGRSEKADVSLKRSELSRNHFRIDVSDGSLFITDLGSANGINLNGVRIPADQKTPYLTFQSLDISELITFTISDFDEHPLSPSSAKALPRKKMQTTDTVKPQTQVFSYVISGVTIVSIALLITFKNFPEFFRSTDLKVVPVQTSGNQKKLDADISAMNFKDFITRASCDGTEGLCEDIGLEGPKEGVLNHEGNLLVFVNLDAFSEEGAHRGFRSLGKRERQEIILAKFGTHPELVDYAKEMLAKRLLVIGFTNIDDIVILQSLLKVNSEMVPDLNYNVHENLFGQVYFSGHLKLYNRYLKKALQLYSI